MPDKYKFLTTHLEKAIRELVHKACEPVWDGTSEDRRPETRREWLQWQEDLVASAQAVREALEE